MAGRVMRRGGSGAAGWEGGETTFTPFKAEGSDSENSALLETVTQYVIITHNGKESKKAYICTYIYEKNILIYIHITESLCCTPETSTTL